MTIGWLGAHNSRNRVYKVSFVFGDNPAQFAAGSGQQSSGSSDGGALRAQLEQALKDIKELKAVNDELKRVNRAAAVAAALKAKGYPEKVARLVPVDVEPTEEAVTKWLEEYKDVLPAPVSGETSGTAGDLAGAPPEGGQGQAPEMTAAEKFLAAFAGVQGATSVAKPADLSADLLNKIKSPDMTREMLDQLVAGGGGGLGVG